MPFLDSRPILSASAANKLIGRFELNPTSDFHSSQRYQPRTPILETLFETPHGKAVLIDWMPLAENGMHEAIIHRRIETIEGKVDFNMICSPLFGSRGSDSRGPHTASLGHIEKQGDGVLFRGNAIGDSILLRANVPLAISSQSLAATARFSLETGSSAQFSLTFGRHYPVKHFPTPERTAAYWRMHSHRCSGSAGPRGCIFAGPWHDSVTRSDILLTLMKPFFSSSVAEGVTRPVASIKECLFAAQSCFGLDRKDDARDLLHWLWNIIARDSAQELQAYYSLDGGREDFPRDIHAPVFQLDTFGYVWIAAATYYRQWASLPEGLWPHLAEIADYLCQAWKRPDHGPWGLHTRAEHWVTSKALCWIALDHACKLAEALQLKAPTRWKDQRQILHHTICDQGYDTRRNSFVRVFGGDDLDTSVLLLPLLGFLPWMDERIQSTLGVIEAELSEGPFLRRFSSPPESTTDPRTADPLSTLWLVSCLANSGRVDSAVDLFAEVCTYSAPLGLFANRVHPVLGSVTETELKGESSSDWTARVPLSTTLASTSLIFPSTAVHSALILAGLNIGRARTRPELTQAA